MKKTSFHLVLLTVLLTAASSSSKAQFFKDVLNSVKNTAQGRANNKADQTTNKAIDKVDGSGTTKSGTPPDTSAAGMMKNLGLMTGGGGVSASDSAAAIDTYMKGKGGSGFYYQYLMTATSKKGTMKDTSYKWLTNGGEGRSEMRILMPGAASGKLIVVGRADQPRYSILLDPDNKGYSLNLIDTALINSVHQTYKVTKVGDETVDGYSCVHVKLTSTSGSGLFKSSSTEDLWTSTAVPGYSLYHNLSDQTVSYGMMQALEKAGAAGIMVKMTASGKDYSMSYDLADARPGSYPASLFMIPAGYTNNHKNIMEYMMSGMSGAQQTNPSK
ncbi:MAG TPA: DUF4412 domain-containing protein [Puia sp.]|jgi:hypothetical protein